jgi:predicted esterase
MKDVNILGWNVLYYPGADERNEPLAATVVQCHGNGLNLHVMSKDSPIVVFKAAVWHVSDARFKENPAMSRHGAWDVLPKDKKLFEQLKQQAAVAAEKKAQEKIAANAAK